ncbi:hypothetical protein BJ875DRAFT_265946 [Amylocarpus encephaloides]|uniref:Myb-like domain-containing protein n=1 Tax=Amylocarpus encephaloides TaxID=45428 RepID=A0A9P7YKZ8_9HELO|nr:hypothetical protein BJ875DRAFT_265946 [Amylocarpus encephaloides]
MDDIVFYQPPSALRSQSRLAGTVTASHLPLIPITSLPTRQTATPVSTLSQTTPVSTLSQKTHTLDRYCRNDKQDFTASRNHPNRCDNDDDEFPDIQELLSGIRQKSMPITADLNGDNHDGFIDIDEFLSGRQQEGPTSVDPDFGRMADIVDSGTRGGSPISSRSTIGSSRDPIILSDNESANTESETDYSNLKVDLTTNSDSSPPHIADNDMAVREGFGSGTTHISDDDNESGGVDGATLQFPADLPISVSPSHGSFTHQASPMQVNSEIIQGSASYADLDVTKKAEEDNANTRSTKRSDSSAVSSDKLASHFNVCELLAGQHDSAQFPQPGPAAASLHQSDLTNDSLQRPHHQRDDTKNVRHKRLRTLSPTGPASIASPVSAALESNEFQRSQSVTRLVAPAKEREIRNIDHEMADGGDSDDSNDKDYDDMNHAAASEMRYPPRSRKRVKRGNMKPNDVEIPSTQSLNILCEAIATTSSVSMQESEEIPIRGFLTLKTIESKVVYCLTFSQELLPEPSGISQRQDIPRSVSSSSDRGKLEKLSVREEVMSRLVKKPRFSSEEDDLLLQKKGEGLSWDEISEHFPERTKGTLQVHYSTKLKPRLETSKHTKKRRRSE